MVGSAPPPDIMRWILILLHTSRLKVHYKIRYKMKSPPPRPISDRLKPPVNDPATEQSSTRATERSSDRATERPSEKFINSSSRASLDTMPEPSDVENYSVTLFTRVGASHGPIIVQQVMLNKKNRSYNCCCRPQGPTKTDNSVFQKKI